MSDEETKARIADSLDKAKMAIDAMQSATDGLVDIVRLVQRRKPDVCYFGVGEHDRAGHFWHGAPGGKHGDGPVSRIDAVFAARDGYGSQIGQGIARTVLFQGCTIVQWWDSSADHRGGCNSSFVARGLFTFDEMMAAGDERFPWVRARCKRAGFDVVSE